MDIDECRKEFESGYKWPLERRDHGYENAYIQTAWEDAQRIWKAAQASPKSRDIGRRVVCAANRHKFTGEIVLGVRHYDNFMHQQIGRSESNWGDPVEQGFIDQRGVFLTREEAFVVASEAGQIMRRVGGDDGKLFSENLY